jgi:hypothetical protein
MNKTASVFILYTVTIIVIGFLLYTVLNRQQKIKTSQVINEIPPPQRFETHWWGYGWRPWWKKYNGLPGIETVKPAKIPKSIIIPNAP